VSGQIPVLDGLRGIAILMVLFFHATFVQPGPPLDSLLHFTFRSFGWAGVDLFFVLSGFLITGGLLDTRAGSASPHPPRYFRNFYARRTLRIFPVYYGYLVLFLLLAPRHVVDGVRGDLVFFWLYLQNFAVVAAGDFVHTHFLDHFWSLAIEEQWYLVWPLVVLRTTRRQLVVVCAGLVAFSLALRLGLLAAGVSPYAIHVLTPARLDGLAVGALLAAAARGPGGLRRWVPGARLVAAASALGIGALVSLQRGLFFYVLPGTMSLGFTLVALLFGALLVLAVEARAGGTAARLLGGRFLAMFGRYSYTLYVIHEAVRVVFVLALQHFGIKPYQPQPGWIGLQLLVYLGVFGLSLLLAAASYRFYERPILRLKRFFPTRPDAEGVRGGALP
jgi:peptidoglycan/LPS O-acetylase OafA/YrhL